MPNVKPISPHGTTGRYTNHGCRCEECKQAQSQYVKKWREANRERSKAVSKAWQDAHVEERRVKRRASYEANRAIQLAQAKAWDARNREKRALISAQWNQRNPTQRAAVVGRWREANSDRVRQTARAWAERNRELTVHYAATRRFRRRSADTRIVTPAEWRRLTARFDGCCAYCGCRPRRLTQDHIVPLIRGGRHAIGNLLPACQSCNSSKGSKLLIEWLPLRTIPRSAATPG